MINSKVHIPDSLPLLPITDTVIFPYMLLSLYVERETSKNSIEEVLKNNRIIFISTQNSPENTDISINSIFNTGTVAIVLRMRKLKDGRIKVLLQGLSRAVLSKVEKKENYYAAHIKEIPDLEITPLSKKTEKLVEKVKDTLKTLTALGGQSSLDLLMILDEVSQPGKLVDLVTGHFELKTYEMQNILEIFDPEERLHKLLQILEKEVDVIRIQNRIKKIVKNNLSGKTTSEPPLFNQSKVPPNLYSHSDNVSSKNEEIQELNKKIIQAKMPEDIQKDTLKQIARLEKMHPESSEASMIRNYLDWVIDLPWSKSTTDNLDLKRAQTILEKDHFGLNEVKERVLEFLAVRSLKSNANVKSPILCFVGPPGVGKTSLGKSIATSMERKYARIALGGIKDEAEIRGHRRTYVGAMPGKIIQALNQVQSNNPIIVLDEIDKLGADFRGDPSSAMLEVLDPEQNNDFKDHYLNVTFDLSKVMFIATANTIENIPAPLRDRMEVIFISGYTLKEKKEITKKYIIKQQVNDNGLTKNNISFNNKGIEYLISSYTREAGLRNLSREVGSLCRKIAKKVVLKEKKPSLITPEVINDLLGPARYLKEDTLKENKIGISTGLAWTQVGGEVLYVEALRINNAHNSNQDIILTGHLGKVMEESARAAYSYVRTYSETIGISPTWFQKNTIHIHIPAGATPKDGPSAGTTIATALISLITETPVKKDIAMTGEIGLQGQVLPVGGIKEKVLAALNQNIFNVILPIKNKADIENTHNNDLTLKELRKKINFFYVKNLYEVFAIALKTNNKSRLRSKPSVSIAS